MNSNSLIISVLGYTLLGLLRSQPGSGYEIRNVFASALLHRFSSSPGSIYPALKRLEKQGLVRHRGSPRRGQFEITAKGRAALTAWLSKPVVPEDVEGRVDIVMLKFAFMEGLLNQSEQLRFVSSFEQAAQDHLAALVSLRTASGSIMPLHGKLSLDHRIAVMEANAAWVARAKVELARSSQGRQSEP